MKQRNFGDIFQQLLIREDIVKIKEPLFEEVPNVENREILHKVQDEYKKYLHFEEVFWQQKVGYEWFENGDRNTRFFHSIVKDSRKKLQLNRIQNRQGD